MRSLQSNQTSPKTVDAILISPRLGIRLSTINRFAVVI